MTVQTHMAWQYRNPADLIGRRCIALTGMDVTLDGPLDLIRLSEKKCGDDGPISLVVGDRAAHYIDGASTILRGSRHTRIGMVLCPTRHKQSHWIDVRY